MNRNGIVIQDAADIMLQVDAYPSYNLEIGGAMVERPGVVLALILAFIPAAVGGGAAQGNPTGTISGHVADQAGLAVPGATVTAASPALQGVRTATTSENGDYIVPFASTRG
jgi:hypothetical protein